MFTLFAISCRIGGVISSHGNSMYRRDVLNRTPIKASKAANSMYLFTIFCGFLKKLTKFKNLI